MKRVAVLRGGPSDEYSVSMKTGAGVLAALQDSPYLLKDIVITKQGEWLDEGFARNPESALDAVDVVFIALHGQFGEDGQVQRILHRKGIPYTGSAPFSTAIAFNKELTKRTLRPYGIPMPRHRLVRAPELNVIDEVVEQVIFSLGRDLIVKPVATGSSIGTTFVSSSQSLAAALLELLSKYPQVLVEEYIRGKEATVGVLNDFRGESLYALPVVEIVPPGGEPLFSEARKYDGTTTEVVPGRFTYHEKDALADAARLVHKAIGCTHYSRSDFIVRNGNVYFLEVNTLPGLTSESLFPKATAAVGLEFPQLIRHLIETATV